MTERPSTKTETVIRKNDINYIHVYINSYLLLILRHVEENSYVKKKLGSFKSRNKDVYKKGGEREKRVKH